MDNPPSDPVGAVTNLLACVRSMQEMLAEFDDPQYWDAATWDAIDLSELAAREALPALRSMQEENAKLEYVREDMEHGGVNCIEAIGERDSLRSQLAAAQDERDRLSRMHVKVRDAVLTLQDTPADSVLGQNGVDAIDALCSAYDEYGCWEALENRFASVEEQESARFAQFKRMAKQVLDARSERDEAQERERVLREACEKEIAEVEADERHHYPPAAHNVNAVLAMIQVKKNTAERILAALRPANAGEESQDAV